MEFKVGKLTHKGYAISELNSKELRIWNGLPDEIISAEKPKRRKWKTGVIADSIIEASPHRIEPLEPDHFLSCSPWQIMDYDYENKTKESLIRNLFTKHEIDINNQNFEIIHDDKLFGYRNKMEFSFYADDNDIIHLSFHKRGSKGVIPIESCELAHPSINEVAGTIVEWVNEVKIQRRSLKTLILRSNEQGEVIAALFIKDELGFDLLPTLNDKLLGFSIFFSNPKSPASVPTKLLYEKGQNYLTDKIFGKELQFGLLSFFQVNIPLFEKALELIQKMIPENSEVLDLYSGVGSISLPISEKMKHCTLVEINEEAVGFANENINANNIENCDAICMPSEKVTEIITSEKIVILDPPRAGLHPNVIKKLNETKPRKIIYLSCNPVTQMRNIAEVIDGFKITCIQPFNFFPRTPHIENLIVLERVN